MGILLRCQRRPDHRMTIGKDETVKAFDIVGYTYKAEDMIETLEKAATYDIGMKSKRPGKWHIVARFQWRNADSQSICGISVIRAPDDANEFSTSGPVLIAKRISALPWACRRCIKKGLAA